MIVGFVLQFQLVHVLQDLAFLAFRSLLCAFSMKFSHFRIYQGTDFCRSLASHYNFSAFSFVGNDGTSRNIKLHSLNFPRDVG